MSEEFDKDGFLAKRFGSKANKRRIGKQKWRVYYVNLIGSSLHYYKDIDDVEPKDTIQLKGFKLTTDDSQGSRKKYTILLKNDKEDNYLFSCEDESDWKEWTTAITNAFDKPTKPPLTKEKKKGRIEQLANKAKKNVAGKVATSALGKKAIRSHAPEEVKNLIKSINTLVEQESKGSKKAGEIEENIFKIGIKSYFLVDEGKVTIDDILQADVPLRKALEILCKCFDHAKYSRKVDQNALQQRFTEAQKLGVEAGQILTKCVEPHLKPHNVARINETLTYLLNPEFLLKVFLDEKLDDALQELISAAEHYTQFHFYSEK